MHVLKEIVIVMMKSGVYRKVGSWMKRQKLQGPMMTLLRSDRLELFSPFRYLGDGRERGGPGPA